MTSKEFERTGKALEPFPQTGYKTFQTRNFKSQLGDFGMQFLVALSEELDLLLRLGHCTTEDVGEGDFHPKGNSDNVHLFLSFLKLAGKAVVPTDGGLEAFD